MKKFVCSVCGAKGGIDQARECLELHFPGGEPAGEQSGIYRQYYQEIVKYIEEGEE